MMACAASVLLAVTLSACGGGGGGPVTDAAVVPGDEDAVMPPSPGAYEIESHLDSVLYSSDTEIFSFGGAVAVCLALDCPQGDTIYVGHLSDRGDVLDTSGFEFIERREGVYFAGRVTQSQYGDYTTDYRTLAGWLDHTMFLVMIRNEYDNSGQSFMSYDLNSTGNSSGTNPASPVSGSATWSGAMAGTVLPYFSEYGDGFARLTEEDADFVTGRDGDFVSGDAKITIPSFDMNTGPSLNLEFSNIVNASTGDRRNNMSWEGLEIVDGAFGYAGDTSASDYAGIPIVGQHEGVAGQLYGQFYGPDHEEVGGQFIRDGIGGAFAASRDE